jgi:hypothetical protein
VVDPGSVWGTSVRAEGSLAFLLCNIFGSYD